ncbi:DUF269 domain-containing protein [Gorillibacterium sp. sgz5001074]|uniref:DUF269 domain-containing protein n=1 Tax=Gorillibacterium sp. sgz5001074 TaxID=3446695 RepID=UPI003F67BF3F
MIGDTGDAVAAAGNAVGTGAADKIMPFRRHNPLPFERCVLSILDAHDRYGLLGRKTKEEKLKKHFLLDKESVRGGSTLCGTDSASIRRQAEVFFKAVAMAIDMRTGVPTCSIVEMDAEGFGRAVVYSGRLVLAAQAWRQGQFGFSAMEDVEREASRLITGSIEWLERYPDMARAEV